MAGLSLLWVLTPEQAREHAEALTKAHAASVLHESTESMDTAILKEAAAASSTGSAGAEDKSVAAPLADALATHTVLIAEMWGLPTECGECSAPCEWDPDAR